LAGTRSAPVSLFVILIIHTVCSLPVWLAHFLSTSISPSTCELNCHPERGDSTSMQCQNKFMIQLRKLSFEKLIAVAGTHCGRISAINQSLEIITGDTLYLNILLKIGKSCAL
jgi:hypothetical protein